MTPITKAICPHLLPATALAHPSRLWVVECGTATISIDLNGPLAAAVPKSYVAFSVDSADMYYPTDWTSPQLINLVKQLSVPGELGAIIRLGGSASNDWTYVGAAGYS